ncbi:MAG: hypothetical protein MUC67_08160 [Acidobacteria bacterium]|jgi:hypothetical protein|nr:hypothetical protein [Acidobacteriota bacterium]
MIRCCCLLFALAFGGAGGVLAQNPPAAAPPSPAPNYSLETYEAFRARTADVMNPTQRAERLAEIALVERPGGELQQMVDTALDEEIIEAKGALRRIFTSGDETAKVRVMELFARHWRDQLGVGFEPAFVDTVRRGLEDPSPRVRQATMAFTARNHLPRLANFVIDAAESDPRLTVGALLSIAQSRDPIGARWATEKLVSPDPAVHDAALLATAATGRRATFYLRTMAESPDAKTRRAGIDGLLAVAEGDDRAFLAAWLERDGSAPAELRERVVRAIAELEIGTYQPTLPKPPPFPFPS